MDLGVHVDLGPSVRRMRTLCVAEKGSCCDLLTMVDGSRSGWRHRWLSPVGAQCVEAGPRWLVRRWSSEAPPDLVACNGRRDG